MEKRRRIVDVSLGLSRAGGSKMSTSHAAQDRFACGWCGRRYRWKPELAGRAVRCACGQVMPYPAEDPGDGADAVDAGGADLYDVAPDAGAPVQSGAGARRLSAGPTSAASGSGGGGGGGAVSLAYRRPTEDTGRVDAYFPNKTIDFYG